MVAAPAGTGHGVTNEPPKSPRNNDAACLHPALAPKVEAIDGLIDRFDLPFRRFEGFRDPETQARALADGRSKGGPWRSYHGFGLAVDYVGHVAGGWTWHHELPWDELGTIYETVGMEWAGRWRTFREMVHGQLPIRSLRELRSGNLGTRNREWLLWFFGESPASPPHVGWLQRQLNMLLDAGLDVDSALGPMTGDALLDYSARHGLAWAECPQSAAVLISITAHLLRDEP